MNRESITVTILILIDGFLQSNEGKEGIDGCPRHNPYFNRWFSAIHLIKDYLKSIQIVTILILIDGFLQ